MNQRWPSCVAAAILMGLALVPSARAQGRSGDYGDLVTLFQEIGKSLEPRLQNGVPDYSASAMEAQQSSLAGFRRRLEAIDPSGWTLPQQVDYHIVRAQLNGVDFNHRVLRPWARDPGFYLTAVYPTQNVPRLPLASDALEGFRTRLKAVPASLEQAKRNLTEPVADLARVAIRGRRREIDLIYRDLISGLARHHPDLVPDAERARTAIEAFRGWLEQNVGRMGGPVGLGADHYYWYLKNVALLPYTMEEVRLIGEREYERSMAFLRIEENKNRAFQALQPARDENEFRRRVQEADEHILAFIREQGILTAPGSYEPSEPDQLWAIRPGPFERPGGERNFFQQGEDRDPRPLQLHITVPGHHFDGVMARANKHPIRGSRGFWGIGTLRTEGWAFYVEEMMLQAGLMDKLPRAREIAYVYQAMRAARTPAELRTHANEINYEQALGYMAGLAPYWLYEDDPDLEYEFGIYLRRPTSGIAYLIGKVQIEQLLQDRSRQLGDKFSLRAFHDEFLAAGRIPISLIRWELTGLDDQVKELW